MAAASQAEAAVAKEAKKDEAKSGGSKEETKEEAKVETQDAYIVQPTVVTTDNLKPRFFTVFYSTYTQIGPNNRLISTTRSEQSKIAA